MLLGYSTWGMPKLPIDAIVAHLSSLGFDAIEITVLPGYSTALKDLGTDERRRIPELLRFHGLTLSALMAYLPLAIDDVDTYRRHATDLNDAIDLAVDWTQGDSPPPVITGMGGRPGELDSIMPRLVERLEQLGERAQAAGVTIALEHHIDTAVETPDDVVRLMAQIESPAIRINFDISHFNVLAIPIKKSVAQMLPYCVHTHIKDERGHAPDYEYLIPGEGECDYVTYLKAMMNHNSTGCVSVEISKMVQGRPNYDPLAAATRSYRVLNQAFVDAGIQREGLAS